MAAASVERIARIPVMHDVRIGELEGGATADWDEYMRAAPESSIYHASPWRDLIHDLFRHETCYLVARGGDRRIVGGLPLVRLRSALFGDFCVSLPYFNYGGVVADTPDIANDLVNAAVSRARSLGVSHVELRHQANVCPHWPARTDKVSMLLKLPASAAALQNQLGAKLRSQIKRPVREGATCVSGGIELLRDFYAVFSRNMRDLGTPVYPRRFFERILQSFPQQTRLFVVRAAGQPLAAGFCVRHRDTLEIPWASSLRSANAIGVNMLLYWSVLEYAAENGVGTFDFGRSTHDSGTFRFKKQWGAEPRQLHWHYWLRDGGEPPLLNAANPKYRLAIAAWQRLPVPVANLLGPLIVRNLP